MNNENAIIAYEKHLSYQEDMSLWAREKCKFKATWQQEEVLKALSVPNARVSVKSGHGTGKTALAAIAIDAMLDLYDDVKVLCTAPSKSQLKDFLWKECSKWINKMAPEDKEKYDWTADHISMIDKPELTQVRYAMAKTANKDKPEALQGGHGKHVLFVIDEATGVDDPIYGPMEGALTGDDCRVLMISNPTRTSGYFWRSQQPEMKHRWKQFTLSCVESPNVDPTYWQNLRDDYGEESNYYRIRVLGEFPKADDDVLIPIEWITDAIGRPIEASGDKIAGLDVGASGDDSALSILQGQVLIWCEKWHLEDTMQTAGRVCEILKKHKCKKINVDSNGMGLGVAHRLGELGFDVECINSQESSAYKKDFVRLRDQLWWTARDFFESKVCSLDKRIPEETIDALTAELSRMHWETTSAGKKQVEAKHTRVKDKYSERAKTRKSPNLADSFCLSIFNAGILGLGSFEPTNEVGYLEEPEGTLADCWL